MVGILSFLALVVLGGRVCVAFGLIGGDPWIGLVGSVWVGFNVASYECEGG
jgi:hypothetical protein